MRASLATVIAIACTLAGPAHAQTLYKYRDDQGRWHFTDRQPSAREGVQTTELAPARYTFDVILEAVQESGRIALYATNEFHAPVELRLRLVNADNLASSPPEAFSTVLPPDSRTVVTEAEVDTDGGAPRLQYGAAYMIGDPAARHAPDALYRVPYAVGQSYRVTQTYPGSATHTTPGTRHALDIAMPEGTGIYAARGGIVVSVAYDSYSGGTDAGDAPKANMVRILHDDGTMAVYAHLQWESVRIRPGDKVERGQYIARSGNTGFSTGPHLHFAVERNTGLQLTAVPLRFQGPGGEAVTPQVLQTLTAH